MVADQTDGRQVHHTQFLVQNLVISQIIVLDCIRHPEGVGGIHTIDFGRLEYKLSVDLNAAQARSRVSSKKRITGASGENNDIAAAKMADSSASIVMLDHATHGNGRHDAGGNPGPL